MTTKVIFRKWKKSHSENQSIIAIFPETLSCNNPYYCSSWEYVGEHSSCEPHGVIANTLPVSPDEYALDKKFLEDNYGYELEVVTRYLKKYQDTRKAEVATYL